jgi:ATP-dependent DNA helicase DinG
MSIAGVHMDSSRFTKAAGKILLEAIADAQGREVLAVGQLDKDGLICEITVAARGAADAVPALLPHMQQGDVVIHNHPSGNTGPSTADLHVATGLGNQGIGFYITDNNLDSIYVVAEAIQAGRRTPIDLQKVALHLLSGGSLSKTVDYYEARDSQVQMLEAVVRGFNDNSIIIAEAGTGVGKSLAYLLPAFQWAAENDERVVISTATINLQQQLIESDIPLVRRITGLEMKAHLAKGRGNYLCLRRLGEALEEDALFIEEESELHAIGMWSRSTATGGKEDLSFLPPEGLWSRVCSEADTCLGLRCARRDDCFVLKARREAASAQILVVNHHLLFSDQSIRAAGAGYDISAVLPPFQKIIFDEAHNIEKSATSFFSESLSRYSVNRTLSAIYRVKRGRPAGLAISLRGLTEKREYLDSIPALISEARTEAETLDSAGRVQDGGKMARFSRGQTNSWRDTVLENMLALENRLAPIILNLHTIVDEYRDEEEPEPIVAAKSVIRRLEAYSHFCNGFSEYEEHPERVFWIENRKTTAGEAFTVFNSTPVEIAPIMRETIFAHYDTVVCTSATLTVRNDFTYWYRRVGLDAGGGVPAESHSLPSPFPYADNVLLAAPVDGPEPAEAEYGEYVASFVRDAIELSEGGALVLFTSYKMLSEVYEAISLELANMGITLLRQGSDDRRRLLMKFSEDEGSVLFATDSFWEGVDAPGQALRLLIICRLPFQVPNDPVVEARYERIIEKGGNPFIELSLPEAVTRFKQGFGRLIRRNTDRGVVLVLDSRIAKKQYGSAFVDSLPETQRCFGTRDIIFKNMERMLYDV